MIAVRIRFFIAVLILVGCASGKDNSDPWLILADGKQGSINVHTRRQDLVQAYGAKNVVDGDIGIGEGEVESGTVLFPHDPERSIEILWNDTENKADPSSLTIRGDKSRWKAHDVSLGTTLKQLERLNGKSFHMSGYGWDYSGTVLSWDKGTLAHDLGEFDPQGAEPGRVILRLECGAVRLTQDEELQVAGDHDFSSDHPVLQKLNPCVSEMVWVFPQKRKN